MSSLCAGIVSFVVVYKLHGEAEVILFLAKSSTIFAFVMKSIPKITSWGEWGRIRNVTGTGFDSGCRRTGRDNFPMIGTFSLLTVVMADSVGVTNA